MLSLTAYPAFFSFAIIGTLYAFRRIQEWLKRLETQSRAKLIHTIEDPTSPRLVDSPSLFSEPSKSLSLVVPAFNEEERLPATLDEALCFLDSRRRKVGNYFTFEVIIVDDGSTDRTAKVAFDYVKKHGFDTVRLLRLPENCGKGCAVKQGMLCARGCTILMMDADGATQVSDFEKLNDSLQQLVEAQGADCAHGKGLAAVYGSRHHLQAKACAKRAWYRNLMMRVFHVLVLIVAGPACPKDTQCGFKLFTRGAARLLFPNQRLQRWCFDVEITWLASQLGVPIAEVGVNWTEIPGSKIRLTSIFTMILELAIVELAYKLIGTWKVRSEAEIGSTPS